ncbi:transposase, partial [Salinisphaera sp. G21_0]|uniref:transposase n=1 Tax=Salinisphaera sp. G21_0 TaxID=2821094 RepID=UPI001ADA92C4
QPKSALSLLGGNAGTALDLEALFEAIQTIDGVILEKDNALLEKDDIIQKKSIVIEEQKKRIAILEEYLRLERARLYGHSSEKFSGQGEIFNEAELADCGADPAEEDALNEEELETGESPKPRKKRKGRTPLSPALPRVQERIELNPEEKQGAIETFFTKVREELDIIPARVGIPEAFGHPFR